MSYEIPQEGGSWDEEIEKLANALTQGAWAGANVGARAQESGRGTTGGIRTGREERRGTCRGF